MIPKLSGRKLKNHSFQHSFIFKTENGKSLMRAKKYPQHKEWSPPEGIQLLKENQDFPLVPVSPFRVEKLCLEKVYADLVTKYFPTLELRNRREVEASWERTKTLIENLPRRSSNLPKMNLQRLPKQVDEPIPIPPSYLEPFMVREERELEGQKGVLEARDGDFFDEITAQMDVAIYSETKVNRPWVGRVQELLSETREFRIRWYERKHKKSLVFHPSVNNDGSPYLSVVSVDTVMFWEFTEKLSDDSFKVSREWLAKISDGYDSHDQCNI